MKDHAFVGALGLRESGDAYGLVRCDLSRLGTGMKNGFHPVGSLEKLPGPLKRERAVGHRKREESQGRIGGSTGEKADRPDERDRRAVCQEAHLPVRAGWLENARNHHFRRRFPLASHALPGAACRGEDNRVPDRS